MDRHQVLAGLIGRVRGLPDADAASALIEGLRRSSLALVPYDCPDAAVGEVMTWTGCGCPNRGFEALNCAIHIMDRPGHYEDEKLDELRRIGAGELDLEDWRGQQRALRDEPFAAYVCGLMFSADRARVALIRKRKGHRHEGRMNGIGGLIEVSDATPLAAMAREFKEEAGIDHSEWEPVARLGGPDFVVHFFSAFTDAIGGVRTETDEVVEVHPVDGLAELPLMANLRVIIPLALDQSGIVKPVRLSDCVPQPNQGQAQPNAEIEALLGYAGQQT